MVYNIIKSFIVGHFYELGNEINGDIIVISPSCGGPKYNRRSTIEPFANLLDKTLMVGRRITPKMSLHFPKNLNKEEVCTLYSLNIN